MLINPVAFLSTSPLGSQYISINIKIKDQSIEIVLNRERQNGEGVRNGIRN